MINKVHKDPILREFMFLVGETNTDQINNTVSDYDKCWEEK